MNECNFCRYMMDDNDPSKQTCSKWVNKSDINIPCRPEGGELGGPPNNNSDNCIKIDCQNVCQYPFTKEIYNDHSSIHYDHNDMYPSLKFLNENPIELNNYINNATNSDLIKEEYRQYTSENVPQDLNLKCGPLLSSENSECSDQDGIVARSSDGNSEYQCNEVEWLCNDYPEIAQKCKRTCGKCPEEDENKIFNFPDLPEESILRQVIENENELQQTGIYWGALKETPKLIKDFGEQINEDKTSVVINDFTIPIQENGIELEWWEREELSNEELMSPLPATIRDYQSLENIHRITGGILEHIFLDHTVDRMVSEEVYDWLIKNDMEKDDHITMGKFSMSKLFGIKTDDVTDRDFEICMNKIMMTEHDDKMHIRRINQLSNLTDLGDPNNREELLYIEAKIIKFLIIDPSDISDCFDIVYLTDEICKIGLTSNATQLVGQFLKLNTDNTNDEKYDDRMRLISKRLLKYLPDVIEKIIDIAEHYEKQKCNGELHKNTKILKEIYSSLFTQRKMDIDLPNLGVQEFFRDFQENILTKIILLIFIAYIVTQLIKLFNVNVNLSGGKGK